MQLLCFFLLVSCALCVRETTLESDASNPYGVQEFVTTMSLSAPIPNYAEVYKRSSDALKKYDASVDHRSWVGPCKQQSETAEEIDVGCGSCATFAAIAAAELAYYKKFKKIANFSEMELVDCMYHAGGCNGNILPYAIKHVFNNGVATRKDYPYKPTDLEICEAKVTRYYKNKFVPYEIDPKDEKLWKTFVTQYGGVAMAFYYGDFIKNRDGIVIDCEGASTHPGRINHGVSIVGYSQINGVEYYLVRNSWGTTAYDHYNGYFKLKSGACNSNILPFYGYIFDSCSEYNSKDKCKADPTCTWSFFKCKSDFITFKTKVSNALTGVASKIDKVFDKFDGVGLSEIPSTHALRSSTLIGTEFMCYLKEAGENDSVKEVLEWYDKALKAKAIQTNGKIRDYAKLRKLLGIKKPLTTYIATKAHLDPFYQAKDEYRFHVLPGYWDARTNQKEKADFYLLLGTSKDGVKKFFE